MARKIIADLAEDESIAFLLEKAEKLRTNDDEYRYEACWLKAGAIGDAKWTIVDYNKQDNEYTYSFDAPLPDGTSLIDPVNLNLLVPIQKMAFHMHMGDVNGDIKTGRACFTVVEAAINLARWMVLHEAVFLPRQHGFMLMTEDHMIGYLAAFSKGGVISTLTLIERFLVISYENTSTQYTIQEILNIKSSLPKDFIKSVKIWLDETGGIIWNKARREKIISRRFLSKLLGCSVAVFNNYIPMVDLLNQFDEPILPNSTEPTKTKPMKPVKTNSPRHSSITKHTLRYYVRHMKMFFLGHTFLPHDIPFISESTYQKVDISTLRRDGHTRLVPIEIGIEAIDKAAEMVIVYGEAIVDAVVDLAQKYVEIRERYNSSATLSKQLMKDFAESKNIKSELPNNLTSLQKLIERFNVISYVSSSTSLDVQRGITLKTLHQAFYGACALLIGMCKPTREGELYKLKYDCLESEFQGGGVLLIQELEKSGHIGVRQIITRPIPYLVARAIQLLQVLSFKLRVIYNDQNGLMADHLFYIPDDYVRAPKGKSLLVKVNNAIDTFCHLWQLPADQYGEPWLIRVHEMRKFFILIMYKHHDGRLRDILSYAAGHTNPEDIDAYITLSHDDPEQLRYESECLSDKLFNLELGSIVQTGNDGLSALYFHVCNHFNVTTLSALSKDKFCRFLSIVQISGSYQSKVYAVEVTSSQGSLTTLDFAIKYNGIADDKYWE